MTAKEAAQAAGVVLGRRAESWAEWIGRRIARAAAKGEYRLEVRCPEAVWDDVAAVLLKLGYRVQPCIYTIIDHDIRMKYKHHYRNWMWVAWGHE
jgi:hypothetical protein